jgi:hypothetical protein
MWQSRPLVTDSEMAPVAITKGGFVVPTDT